MKNRWKALAGVAVAAALVVAPIMATGAVATDGDDEQKVFVCKYVGTPGDDERLQDGGNPTNPSVNSIKSKFNDGVVTVGSFFGDSQGRSFVLAFDTGQDDPPRSACPGGVDQVPVPALFNAAPTAPTCAAAGALPDLSETFPHVTLSFNRPFVGPGVYTLTATAADGFEFEGGLTQVSRDITVLEAVGFQSTNAEAPCYLAPGDIPVTLSAPIVYDVCGTADDFGDLPENTTGVTYEWADDTDDENLDVIAFVDEGFVVSTVPEGWIDLGEGAYGYPWTYVFTDEPCPVVTPPPAPALAATGGDMSPLLPIGAGMLMLTGVALMVARRLIRH